MCSPDTKPGMEFPAPRTSARYIAAALCLAACLLGLALGSLFLVPPHLQYTVTPTELIVDARLGWLDQGRRIARADIENPRALRVTRSQRVVGTAVPGYCQGRFRVAELGTVWQATTCGSDIVALDTPERIVVLAPADRETFLDAVARGEPGSFDPAPVPSTGLAPGWLVLLVLPLLALVWTAWRLMQPMVYRVDGSVLVVPGLWRGVQVQLPGARARREPLRKAWRIAGAALPGLYLGWFTAEGKSMHVAATNLDDGVRIDGDRRVYVTPADLEGFLAALQRAGVITGPRAFEGS